MRLIGIPKHIKRTLNAVVNTDEERIADIKTNYKKLTNNTERATACPEVSVVIPAYNEEKNILPTLQSICANITTRRVEVIVVNNNSSDTTEELINKTGVVCVNETIPGVTAARNAGLKVAKGTYILNADADTLYPETWIENLVAPLAQDEKLCMTYGLFSFIPTGVTPRLTYFFYESIVDILRFKNRKWGEEAVNVGGCSSCFRRAQGIAVSGFDHPKEANEDGYLALKLRDKGFGRLQLIKNNKSIVWTTDRRIQMDGGLFKGIVKRIKRVFFKSGEQYKRL